MPDHPDFDDCDYGWTDEDYPYEDDFDEEDIAAQECTWDGTPGNWCGHVGSEQCDWECPYSNEMHAGLRSEPID